VMQRTVEKSKLPLRDAVELDKEGKKMEAVAKYVEGISLLMEAMAYAVSLREKDALKNTISKYMVRAETLKGQAKLKVDSLEQRHIKEGTTGHGYDKIFAKCIDDTLSEVNVEDAYIIAHHQILNFVRFCEFCVLHARNLRRIRLRTQRDGQNEEALAELGRSLSSRGIELIVVFDHLIHDREIRFDNGWIVKIGRGLDYFHNPGRYGLGAGDLNLRRCHETNVDIFRMR
uniref:MIT domain-containing protein n=1 Tax=Parascaris univalens TaxID=6257 RepID=A0A915BDW9_PARUN